MGMFWTTGASAQSEYPIAGTNNAMGGPGSTLRSQRHPRSLRSAMRPKLGATTYQDGYGTNTSTFWIMGASAWAEYSLTGTKTTMGGPGATRGNQWDP